MLGKRVIALRGEIDIYTVEETRRALDAIDGPAVVDLSDVGFLSAAGLTELARVAKRVGRRSISLVGTRPHVRRVLAIVRFGELFTIE